VVETAPGSLIRLSADRFIDAVVGMTDEQWSYRPRNGGWTASEVTEHVTIANRNIFLLLEKRLESPVPGLQGVSDDEIPYLFYRGDEPPDVAAPTGIWTDIAAAAKALDASADDLATWANTTELDLRAHGVVHPAFGALDAHQWLLFAHAHTERHRAQVIGLERQAGFPSK
jgi:DinB superfamily